MPPEDEEWAEPEPEADPEQEEAAEDEPQYDEDTAALIAAAREEERAKAKVEIDTFKGQYGRRFGKAREALAAQGLEIADDGTPLVRDPQAALAWAKANVVPLAISEAAPVAEPEITLSPYDDEATLTRKAQAMAERASTRAVDAATKPLLERLDAMMGLMGRQAQAGTLDHARAALDDVGLGVLADDPQFQRDYQAMVDQGVKAYGPGVLGDEAFLRSAAGSVAFSLPAETKQKARTPVSTGDPNRDRLIAAQRNGARQVQPSRGIGGDPYTDDEILGAQALGYPVAEYRALGRDRNVDDTIARQRKKNGAAK